VSEGWNYQWETDFGSGDPLPGRIKGNNASLASVTTIRLDNETTPGTSIRSYLAWVGTQTSTTKAVLTIRGATFTQTGTFASYAVSSVSTSDPDHVGLTVAYLDGSGSFSANQAVIVSVSVVGQKGDTGATGPAGATGATGAAGADGVIQYQWSTATSGSLPFGYVRGNNSTLASITQLALHITDYVNVPLATLYAAISNVTSSVKARLYLSDSGTLDFRVFNITEMSDSGLGHWLATVTHESGSGSFTNNEVLRAYIIVFGNKGDTGAGVPTGMVSPYAGSVLPAGWLWCDGSVVSRTTYASLFSAIGGLYGPFNDFDFTLPDLRGRFVAGRDNMNNSVGTGGGDAARLTMPQIDGDVLGATSGAQSHSHTITRSTSTNTATGGSATRVTSVNAATGPSSSLPPTIILNYIIKT
jgi:microcystin-dependent protein